MTDDASFQPDLNFEAASNAASEGQALVIDIDGFEGPLHVLLALARNQKVDLLKLSITKLAEQYLEFVHEARRLHFSLAADYLVMASWLAYLKSRLLLPRNEKKAAEEAPAEVIAAQLAFLLAKLEAMRNAVDDLKARPQLKRDVFLRGDPQATVIIPSDKIDASLYELMRAYVVQRVRETQRHYDPHMRISAYQLDDARDRLREMMPRLDRWVKLTAAAPTPSSEDGPSRASYVASTLSASLELVKEGALEARQLEAFADLYLRRREHGLPLELTAE
ncbi:MAG TPA: ScpA family protein [Caulobacteraceae bacterium]|jgi:segregation and condensation protein A|nr:ScpA family protein [Caulobacteraceae bacterium]